MSDNVLTAIIAGSAVVIGAFATSLVAAVAIRTGNKRLLILIRAWIASTTG